MTRASCVALAAVLAAGCAPRSAVREPLARRSGVYLWHDPINLTAADERGMRALGADDLYSLVGTFSSDGERLVLRLRRRFERGARRLYLVYRFDLGGGKEALDSSPALAADAIAAAYEEDRRRAETQGWRVAGLQLDLDAPTRRLPEYAKLLRDVRDRVRGELAITGLLTWLEGRIELPLASVDFWSPQLYDLSPPSRLEASAPDPGNDLRRALPRLKELGVPFRPVIGTYGQALLYAGGAFAGLGRGLAPSEAAARFPAATLPPSEDQRAGYRLPDGRLLVFRRPDPLAAGMEFAVAAGMRESSGALLFRLPAPGEEATPPLLSLRRSRSTDFPLKVSAAAAISPFAAIERGAAGDERELTLSFRWTADDDPPLRPDAIRIEILLPHGGASVLQPGDFGGMRLVGPGGGTSSLARAERAVVSLSRLTSGAPMRLGPIRLGSIDGSRRGILRVRVTVLGPEGPREWRGEF